MPKYNGCISTISSRTKCLFDCLVSLFDNFNRKAGYPVYVHYFDDIYDNLLFRDRVHKEISDNVTFISIPYKTPAHIPEQELFHNRHDLEYVRKSFTVQRKGFLHMCHFMSNFYGYPNTRFQEYDYTLFIDDESGFTRDMPYDPIELLAEGDDDMGALRVYDQHVKKPHQGNYDTRVDLWDFIKRYMAKEGIEPKSQFIKDLLNDPNEYENFHYYPIADTYVVKLKMFLTPHWQSWMNAVNQHGGIYKYRWGDNDVNSLGYLIHYGSPILDFKTVDEGIHDQGMFKLRQAIAPGIKNPKL